MANPTSPIRRKPSTPPDPREERLRALELRVADLESMLARIGPSPGAAPLPQMSAPAPVYGPFVEVSEPRPSAAAVPQPTPGWAQNAPVSPRRPRPEAPDLERTLGGKWLALGGMLVFVLGVVFFLRYAFDQGWITRLARIAMGVIGGVLLVVVADFLRRRETLRTYAQVLAAGGFSILYFSLFAAYQFPEYRAETHLTLEAASVLLGVVAIALGLYALWRDTPLLLAFAAVLANVTTLFAARFEVFSLVYLGTLTVALLAASLPRGWPWPPYAALGSFLTLFILAALRVDFDGIAVTAAAIAGAVIVLAHLRNRPELGPFGFLGAAFVLGPLPFWDVADWSGLIALGAIAGLAFASAHVRSWPWLHQSATGIVYLCLLGMFETNLDPLPLLIGAGALLIIASLLVLMHRPLPAGQSALWHVVAGATALSGWLVVYVGLNANGWQDWQGPETATDPIADPTRLGPRRPRSRLPVAAHPIRHRRPSGHRVGLVARRRGHRSRPSTPRVAALRPPCSRRGPNVRSPALVPGRP